MIMRRLLGRKADTADVLYEAVVKAARQPHFYRDWGVPDTVDGRFDMIVVHLFLVLERLTDDPKLKQSLTDTFFKDMDRSLREMGVGDLSVGKKVRKMAEACYGRIGAYAKAVQIGEEALSEALARNIFVDVSHGQPNALAKQMLAMRRRLADQETTKIVRGDILWL